LTPALSADGTSALNRAVNSRWVKVAAGGCGLRRGALAATLRALLAWRALDRGPVRAAFVLRFAFCLFAMLVLLCAAMRSAGEANWD
jgi:hypothetical protein